MRLEKLLEHTQKPPQGAIVVLPFANQETIDWLGKGYITMAYANQPRTSAIFDRDSFTNPPKFQGAYVVAFPPWTSKNDVEDKAIYDIYGTDNLYKCFLKMLLKDTPVGGTIIVPLKFLTGMRDSEQERRRQFFRHFETLSLTVFSDIIINDYIPLVINFQRNTEYSSLEKTQKVIIVSESKQPATALWHIDYTKHAHFIKEANPFLKRFKERYTEVNKKKISIQIGHYDSPEQFYVSKATPFLMQTTPFEEATKVSVKGFLSKRLRERICRDFNNLIQNWLIDTSALFTNYIIINGKKEHLLKQELIKEAIQRIIWSYFISEKNQG